MPVEQAAQLRSAQAVLVAISIGQDNQAFACLLVEATMPDKVKNVPRSFKHGVLQGVRCLPLQPCDFDDAGFDQLLYGLGHQLLFTSNVELGEIVGTGDHAEDAQRRLNDQRLLGPAQFQIADEGRFGGKTDVVALGFVVEILPRQRCQLRRLDAQA